MPMKRLWDGHIMLSIMMMLIFAATLSLAHPKPDPQTSIPGWIASVFTGTELPATAENLVKAAEEGNLDDVKELVAKGVDVNFGDGEPITRAANHGHMEVVKHLLEAGANPNGTNDHRSFLGKVISSAGENNHVDIINLLLDAGATVTPEKYGIGVLDRAAENGHLEAIQRLLEAGADPDFGQGYALLLAGKEGHLDVVKAFLDAGADVNNGGAWIIGNAADEGRLEVIKTLIEAGVSKDNLSGALRYASSSDHVDVIKLLIENGADPSYGSILMNAAGHGNVEVVRILLEAGSVIKKDEDVFPPLHYATQQDHRDVMDLLVEYGADINCALPKDYWYEVAKPYFNQRYGNGWTPVHTAARFGHLMTQLLLDLGADINAKDALGRTPLQIAIHYEKLMTAKELLRFCADVTIANKEGKTALDIAKDVALRNATDTTEYRVLMNTLLDVMPEKIATIPFNEVAINALKKEFLATLETNSTLQERLKNVDTYDLDLSNALSRLFENRARNGMVKIFEDRNYKTSTQDQVVVKVDSEYLVTCECVPGQGPKMTLAPIQESAPVSPVQN